MEKKITTPIVKGLLICLVLIIMDLVAGFTNSRLSPWFRWLPIVIVVGGIIWSCISYGNQMENNVSFGNIFGYGFKTSAVVACIMVVYSIISIFVIFPETKELSLDMARKQMEEAGRSEDQINQGLEITKRLFIPFAIGGTLLFILFEGLISSLIGAAVTKKNPQSPFINQP